MSALTRPAACGLLWVPLLFSMLVGSVGATGSGSNSVEPDAWAQADLLVEEEGSFVYDHSKECAMRDAKAAPDERARIRVRARAPRDAMSRDQLVALVQRMEAVFLMSVGQGWRPQATAMEMASILDCRERPNPQASPDRELLLEVADGGFGATFVDHATGVHSRHAETWEEAFRP